MLQYVNIAPAGLRGCVYARLICRLVCPCHGLASAAMSWFGPRAFLGVLCPGAAQLLLSVLHTRLLYAHVIHN